ncbi:MAG: type II toxin-antitoxin system VapC family toxin [Chloroflexi bacterium]|nr:type II toxin-antitoxin system VapC family toxin [Chloroflexota bacterium]MBI3788540.1 type II toxin-antitoxin system VapC family toxin [Ignavibacteriales bacterium]
MTFCVDTDVMVDCLRAVPQARAWLEGITSDSFVVPGIVAMELVVGCANQEELKRTQNFLRTFRVIWPEAHEFARAYELLARHRLSSGLSIPDCLVAAMALNRALSLYTFNQKHYRMVEGLGVQEPYQRAQK